MKRTRLGRMAVAAVAVGATLTLGLTGCSSSGSGSSGASGGKATISYALWDQNQVPAMKKIITAFKKDHPDVTIKIQLTPYASYFTKLQTAVTGGSGPDVFWMNGPNIQLYSANGQLANLDKVDTSKYPKALVNLYSYKGKVYGAPKDFDTIGVWYNKSLFDAAGVAYPKAGWTWDDYLADAKKLTNASSGVWGSAAALAGQENYYDTIAQAGGRVINAAGTKTGYNTPAALKGVDFWVNQIKDGTSPTLAQMTDTLPLDMFTSGKIGMMWTGSWGAVGFEKIPDFKDKIDVAPLPEGPDGNESVIHGLANVVNAKSKNVDVAKEFAVFASGKQASDIQAKTGTVIPAYNGTQQAWVDSMKNFKLESFIKAKATAVPYPVSANTAAWNTVEADVLSQVWALKITPKAGLDELATKMQAILDKK